MIWILEEKETESFRKKRQMDQHRSTPVGPDNQEVY